MVPFPLISDISQGRCLPFIGAGFSKNASLPPNLSMPDWAELTAALAKDAGTTAGTEPTIVAQRYEKLFGRVQLIEAIRELLHPEKAKLGAAHKAFVQLPFDTIYTTNFDLLLEDAYFGATRSFRSLVGELQIPFHAGQLASSIIKMHGDVRHEEHIIITKDDYDHFMDKYPMVATHLSAMLITRTPLFIGYSLTDPDFDNIRRVVRSRLGRLERMSYVVQFDVPSERIEEALNSKLHIISIDSSSALSRDEALARVFKEIQKQLDTKSSASLRTSRPDLFEEIETDVAQKISAQPEQSSVIETTSRLCFVMMPFDRQHNDIYRLLISPAVEDSGLNPLRADEIAGPGFIIEQIRTAIQQSRLCIADITGLNPNVMWEIGHATGLKKPLILIAEEATNLPFDVAHERIIIYGNDFKTARNLLQQAIAIALAQDRLTAAGIHFELAQYRASIAASSVVLEHTLRQALMRRDIQNTPRMSLGQILQTTVRHKILSAEVANDLRKVLSLRNRAVHEIDEPTKDQAQFVLSTVRMTMELLPKQ